MASDLQLKLEFGAREHGTLPATGGYAAIRTNTKANKLDPADRSFHDWYRFVLSYPPHLVRQYVEEFSLDSGDVVLDPFCGTGTTLVEARKLGLPAVGLEANPVAHFASATKTDWDMDSRLLAGLVEEVSAKALRALRASGMKDEAVEKPASIPKELRTLDEERLKLLLANSISPLPLHKTLVLLECLQSCKSHPAFNHALLALADVLVNKVSNLHFGPEVGVGKPKQDAEVIAPWVEKNINIINDLEKFSGASAPQAKVYLADARSAGKFIKPNSISAVITSPPYPNEKDYTRTTRLESVLLGFVNTKDELRALKRGLVRSNTRGVYKQDDDDQWVANHPEINRIANEIEERRISLGKTSGFERMYARVTKLYFGGMARHLAEMRPLLKPGARLAYVVGDQASYLRVMIRTGELLADIAGQLGYEIERIDLFRTRLATASREQLREEVVVLRWPGKK